MGRRGLARCNTCKAPVVFYRSPFTGKPRTFEAKPVEPSHPLAGVKAFPVWGGTAAYRPTHLAEMLQVQRMCSDAEAADEVRDMPWHLIHECPAEQGATDAG